MSKVQDKGEVDKSLENGPTEQRECRDVLCCLLFICAVGLAGYVFINGLVMGKPEKLILLYDSMSNECSGSVKLNITFIIIITFYISLINELKYPYMYYANLDSTNSSRLKERICVSSCPTSFKY
jgi:hypothetical protein